MATIRQCHSCRAKVFWLAHETTGKVAPIDCTPTQDGNILIFTFSGMYRVVPESERATHHLLWTNHFATCPNAMQHHKGVH